MQTSQPDLFEKLSALPPGFRCQANLISTAEERRVVTALEGLQFKEFGFHGVLGKRRVVSYSWRDDFNNGGLQKTDDMPPFLLPMREQAAALAGLKAADLQQVLLTEYRPGAATGWHRDRSMFGDVVAISLVSPCVFRLWRKLGNKWERASIVAEPRSAYLMQGPSRTEWEHSIPGVDSLRYSLLQGVMPTSAARHSVSGRSIPSRSRALSA